MILLSRLCRYGRAAGVHFWRSRPGKCSTMPYKERRSAAPRTSVCAGWQGDWDCAIEDITKAMRMAQQDGLTSMVFPYLLVQSAKAHFYVGKVEEAQSYLDQGMQMAESRQYRQLPAIGRRIQGR